MSDDNKLITITLEPGHSELVRDIADKHGIFGMTSERVTGYGVQKNDAGLRECAEKEKLVIVAPSGQAMDFVEDVHASLFESKQVRGWIAVTPIEFFAVSSKSKTFIQSRGLSIRRFLTGMRKG